PRSPSTMCRSKTILAARRSSCCCNAIENHRDQQSESEFVTSASLNYVIPVGTSNTMKDLLKICDRCAQVNTNLLAYGEEGSGRYTLLRHVHEISTRAKMPFVLIGNDQFNFSKVDEANWSKFKTRLIDSIKFAEGGTVLLQNIDKCNEIVQKRLLDLLQQLVTVQVFKRFNVRFCLSVTNDCPKKLATLYQRMFNMTRVDIPPLRNHVEDIPELLNHSIDEFCTNDNYTYRKFSIAAQNAFLNYSWPANISELMLMVQQLLITGDSEEISVNEAKSVINSHQTIQHDSSDVNSLYDLPLREAREAFEKRYLLHQLKKVDGSVSKLAEVVGLERTHLYRKLRTLGIANKEIS
ncbi:MAG: sigma 54-interacting transcriptional regulator, partial [Pseudomonadota bacterium]